MNEIEIKEGMMRLWKETFHDSEEYVRLVFDAFFNIEMVEYEEIDGNIVAALLAVPYYFGNLGFCRVVHRAAPYWKRSAV